MYQVAKNVSFAAKSTTIVAKKGSQKKTQISPETSPETARNLLGDHVAKV
jgi:hypothetical protein